MNPFQKHDIRDFPDVFVPLASAHRHPSVVAAHDEKLADKNGLSGKDEGVEAANPMYSAYTVEGLRAEIEADVVASGHDSAYDRRCFFFLVFSFLLRRGEEGGGGGEEEWQCGGRGG